MGVIVNPRGTAGAGKTELVRRILRDYGWGQGGEIERIYRPGRERALVYRLRHPQGGRPLAVLGHYEASSGGCDTIRVSDGGMDEVFRLADIYAGDGHDVLMEGRLLSAEAARSIELARRQALHVLWLDTPPECCALNLIARRRERRDNCAALAAAIVPERARIAAACDRLRPHARVKRLDFEAARLRARQLLAVGALEAAG